MRLLQRFAAAMLVCWLPVLAATDDEPTSPPPEEDEREKSDEKKDGGGYRILPIPVFITEPAIGEGLGVAVSLFHPVKKGIPRKPRAATPKSIGDVSGRREAPPVVTSVFGAYTSSGTWAGGVGHFNNWREDRIRYAGVVGIADVISDFYVGDAPIEFKLEGGLVYQDVSFRVGTSGVFLGTALSYLDATNTFDLGLGGLIPPEFLESDLRQVGAAGRFRYEGRDNATMPTRGRLVDFSLWRYDEAIGSDFDYWSAKAKFLSFHPLTDWFVLDLRLELSAIDGDAPFFGFPYIKLRGIPALRFQDEAVGAVEVQGRWLFGERWALLGFGGYGFTSEDAEFAETDESIRNYGAGARFNVFKERSIWVGLDFAKGPEDWNWYLQVNHPW